MALAALCIMTCMYASSIYHLYGCLSNDTYFRLLKFDLVGIGIMIFGLTLLSVYVGFHNWERYRTGTIMVMTFLMVFNFVMQAMPCYSQPSFEPYRIAYYVCTLLICLGLAILGRFFLATDLEVELFYGQLERSFLYLGIGFLFYQTKFPESKFKQEWV